MKHLTFLLIPLLLLSSCSIDWNDEKDKKIVDPAPKIVSSPITQSGIIEKQSTITSTGIQTTEIGSGFTLSSNDTNLDLGYSGKTIKQWKYDFNEFILGNSCTSDENEWKTFNQEKKKTCAKSYMVDSIGIESLNNQIFWIKQGVWEGQLSWLYDTKSNNLQELNEYLIALIPQIKITNTHIYIVIEEGQSIGVQHLLIYDKNFSKKLMEWPKNDNEYFVIDSIEELSPNKIKIKAHDFGEPGVPDSIKKSEHTISIN